MLSIALAKGRLMDKFVAMASAAGFSSPALDVADRKLIVEDQDLGLRYILAKPADVPTYVEYGAADLGVVGKDVLLEADKKVVELLDLNFSRCRLIVAVPKASGIARVEDLGFNSRVASKYPRISRTFFQSRGIQVEIIPLNGSIELGPLVGLSEAIVDITETGRTLLENGLIPIADLMTSSARLVANPVSYKIRRDKISELVQSLRKVVK